ncbi:hypothetical protein HHUSO_G32484 [Huso huso]|uniref:Uncharacterized protein n=1 Tax=Huso huso TaxID=61971 RepID=A0ABR0Y9F5_HUSHU
MAVTTVRRQLLDVVHFLGYILASLLLGSQVSVKTVNKVIFSLRSSIKVVNRDITTHQQVFRAEKSKNLISARSVNRFLVGARRAIPLALARVQEDGSAQCLAAFYGHLAGYLLYLMGNQTGVLTNMLATEVAEAASGRGGLRLINVKKHKTRQIALEREEFQWMEEFLTIRGDLEGSSTVGHPPPSSSVSSPSGPSLYVPLILWAASLARPFR